MPVRADPQGTAPKPKSLTQDFPGSQAAKKGPRAATLTQERNTGAQEAELPWEEKTCFRSAAPQKIVTDRTHLFKNMVFC